jgi:anti-anti-sigma factor
MDSVATEAFADSSRTRLRPNFGDTQSGLRAFTECTGSAVVIHVGGDIDATNAGSWQRLLSRSAAIAIAPGPFVIDVRDLEFMAPCGYAVLAQEAERCNSRGVRLRLVSTQPVVARTIGACGLLRLLPMYASVDHAISPTG